MRLGILADIHEQVEELRNAISVLQNEGADQFVILGDVFETGEKIEETVRLLQDVNAAGVWGNHDFGLCSDPSEQIRKRFSTQVLDFMARLKPRLEIDDCLFTHVEPWLDPHKIEDLWYFDGPPDSPDKLARSFSAVPNRILFMGHMHRWLLGSPGGVLPWRGEKPVYLDSKDRYLVVVHAVCDGSFALFDTSNNELVPFGRT
jgi:Calcineurin-like phosphoesterase superfamily domain